MTDEKDIKSETVAPHQWPTLAKENNKSLINHVSFTLNLDNLEYVPSELLDRALTALGITIDEKGAGSDREVRTLKIRKIRNRTKMASPGDPHPQAENLILTRIITDDDDYDYNYDEDDNDLGDEEDTLQTYFFTQGRLRIKEGYFFDGLLRRRTIFGNEKDSYSEHWNKDGKLVIRFSTDSTTGGFIGPLYRYNDDSKQLNITYWIRGFDVTQREWMDYLEKSKNLVKEQAILNLDVASLINSYITF